MRSHIYTSITKEYGLPWIVNKGLYSLKVKALNTVPCFESIFENECKVCRLDLFDYVLNFKSVESFLQKCSDADQNKIIKAADNAGEGIIVAFSSIELDYGTPIDWSMNPIDKKTVKPNLKWFSIPDFDSEVGDIKTIWEISRFTHFLLFARAGLLTRDEKYHILFSSQLSQWLAANQYSIGPNYKCGQECALRMVNAMMAYSCFKYLGMNTPEDDENITTLIERMYRRIRANFFYANKCIRNNHTLSELTGLLIGAWSCDDDSNIERYRIQINDEFDRQFLSDGGYIQWSFNYQRLALQLAELLTAISKHVGRIFTNSVEEKLLNSVNLLFQMQNDDGTLPNYGNNDGALIFPLTLCDYRDFRPVIDCICKLIANETPYKNGKWIEEALWFDASDNYQVQCGKKKSAAYNDAGLYVLRNDSSYVMTSLQEYGRHRPAHMDQLHIDVFSNGNNVLCDVGTYSYASDIGNKQSMTRSHNTVSVGNLDQMNKKGPFLVYDWTRKITAELSKTKFMGSYESHMGYLHFRSIEFVSDDVLELRDVVKQKRSNKVCLNFHSPFEMVMCDSSIQILENGKLLAEMFFDERSNPIVAVGECNISSLYLQSEKGSMATVTYPCDAWEIVTKIVLH